MTKGGGKGRIPNTLVAASFAAVLTVYGAGYWRTREDARRLDARAQERRPVRAVPAPLPVPVPVSPATGANAAAVLEPPSPSPAPPSAPPSSAMAPPAVTTAPLAAQRVPGPSQPATQPISQPSAPAAAEPAAPAPALVQAAEPASEAPPDSQPAHGSPWRDGTYTGWGTSQHGDIKAQVVIRNGRIVDAGIASCETRYPCDVIGHIIAQPVARQSPDVDAVSRATESADAYYYGLVEALKEAQAAPDGEGAAPP